MMGKKELTAKIFYRFNLDERVPTDHLLRRVLAAVEFSFVTRLTARFYSDTGQPSVDPIVLFQMALLGYLYGITSERRLVQEIELNLAYRWFVGYDLDGDIPDHSVLSKARRRFGPTVYQAFFTEIVRQCDRAGLIRGDKLYVDSTLIAADASLGSVYSRALVRQLPDVGAHVADLWHDNPEEAAPIASPDTIAPRLLAPPTDPPSDQNATLPPAATPAAVPSATPAPPSGGDHPVATAEDSHPANLHLAGKDDAPNAIAGRSNLWAVSRTDPDAEMVSRWGVPLDIYYKVHVGVDAGGARIVTAVEATGGAVAFVRTFRARQSIRRRKVWVETVFGDGKECHGLRRAQFRGRDRMRIQAFLTATAYNVRKLALRTRRKPETGVSAQEKKEIKGDQPSFSFAHRPVSLSNRPRLAPGARNTEFGNGPHLANASSAVV
jgi:transposase